MANPNTTNAIDLETEKGSLTWVVGVELEENVLGPFEDWARANGDRLKEDDRRDMIRIFLELKTLREVILGRLS